VLCSPYHRTFGSMTISRLQFLRQNLRGYVWFSPAVADGKVYVGSCDNKTRAFGPRSVGGFEIPVDKLILLAPYIASAVIIVAVVGSLYAGERWLRKTITQHV